ncbi:metallophosphoesterase family protein [Algoriphagus antarcticus]|uniref:PhoD-like phosphatase n=1 Tax=Algoriphagus antarcticus TaxID=238540 RepID=A0A3E0DVZ2_9BACT|nr:hypothetical protein [Algoriphagus antarcticus]REG90267.1 hypothetical protein C8N25_1074 [Algoriphagus antarcticus]
MAINQPLAVRFANPSFPLILCGPILRRVDSQIASVWVALKEPRRIKLNLYLGYSESDVNKTPDFSSGFIETLPVGEHLHIAIAYVSTKGLLRNGKVYSYDLFFYSPDTDTRVTSLGELNLLKSPVLLGFKENQLPSFVYVPEKLDDLRVAHGSCRKIHGKGRDGLAALSKVMEPDFDIGSEDLPKIRPHCFFHTGDQIYADDSSDFLIEHFTDIGNFLLQRVEQLPYPATADDYFEKQEGNGKKFVWIEAVTEALPPGRRATNFYTGFTGSQTNHLYSFAEFCGAYLLQWSEVLWPEKLQTIPEILKSKSKENEETKPYLFHSKIWEKEFSPPTDWDKMKRKERLNHLNQNDFKKVWEQKLEIPSDLTSNKRSIRKRREKYIQENIEYGSVVNFWGNREEEIKRIEEFRRDLPHARRAMANMPNIMTFDDHDVTDDWYLTGRWTKRTLGTRLGKTIIGNGLLAFALFQAWGNDPLAWSGNALASLLQNTLPENFPANGKEELRRKIQVKLEGIGNEDDGPDEEAAEIDENKLIKELESILKNQLTAASLNFTGSDAAQLVENIVNSLLTEIVTNIPRSESKKKELLDEIPFFVSGMKAYADAHDPKTLVEKETIGTPIQDWAALRSLRINSNLGFDDLDKPKITWHFSFQMGAARVFALDTRTRRDFSAGLDFPPNLIRKKALEEQLPTTALPQGTELAIVISGAPILGLATIESIGQTIVPRVLNAINVFTTKIVISLREAAHKGEESLDVEHWSLHLEGYEALLKKLAFFNKVVCLSGDVHYGITSEMDYWQKDKSHASRFVQMVSSALKNMKPEGTLVGLLPAAFTQVTLTKGLNREMDKLTLIGWDKDTEKLKIRRQFEAGKFRDARPGEFPLRIGYALSKKPVFLPLRDWPLAEFPPATEGGESIVLPRVAINANAPQPTHRWRLNILKDERTDKERFRALGAAFNVEPDEDVPLDINATNYYSSLDQMLERNSFFSRTHFSRAVNWFSNAAIVHFSKNENGEMRALHSLFFYPIYLPKPFCDNPGTFESPYFQQVVSLEQKPESAQPLYPKEPNQN